VDRATVAASVISRMNYNKLQQKRGDCYLQAQLTLNTIRWTRKVKIIQTFEVLRAKNDCGKRRLNSSIANKKSKKTNRKKTQRRLVARIKA
jgi:hypothetical protein